MPSAEADGEQEDDVEWPSEKKKPTLSGRCPSRHQLARRVVDRADVVGVEGMAHAERVGRDPDADAEDAAAEVEVCRRHERRAAGRSRRRGGRARRARAPRPGATPPGSGSARPAPSAILPAAQTVLPSNGPPEILPTAPKRRCRRCYSSSPPYCNRFADTNRSQQVTPSGDDSQARARRFGRRPGGVRVTPPAARKVPACAPAGRGTCARSGVALQADPRSGRAGRRAGRR